MIPFHRYPHPDFKPLHIGGNLTGLAAGATAELLQLPFQPGIKRLRLSHMLTYVTGAVGVYIDSSIEGFPSFYLPGKAVALSTIPLYYTINPQQNGKLIVTNLDPVNPVDISIFLEGFGTNFDKDDSNILNNPRWNKFLIPPIDAVPYVQIFIPPVTFKAPFIGDLIRIYFAQGLFSAFPSFNGEGLDHYSLQYVFNLHGENEEGIPLLGYLKPGQEYSLNSTDHTILLGYGFKW